MGAEEDRGLELESAQDILDTMIGYCEAQLHSASALNADQLAALAQAQRGYAQLYMDHVLQATDGCDFDFLQGV